LPAFENFLFDLILENGVNAEHFAIEYPVGRKPESLSSLVIMLLKAGAKILTEISTPAFTANNTSTSV